jgi:hypothetical protein
MMYCGSYLNTQAAKKLMVIWMNCAESEGNEEGADWCPFARAAKIF